MTRRSVRSCCAEKSSSPADEPSAVLQARYRDVPLPCLQVGQEPLRDAAALRQLAPGEGALLAETTHRGADGGEQDLVLGSHAEAL